MKPCLMLCTKCNAVLNGETYYVLEKNEKNGSYQVWGSVPDTDSGGFFPFCDPCFDAATDEGRARG